MRKIIAALVVSVDGFIEGPAGELDWVDTWEDPFDLLPRSTRHAGLQSDEPALDRRASPGRAPIILGGEKALFKDVKERHALTFHGAKPLKSGLVRLTYRT
jgi:hypothetical protein